MKNVFVRMISLVFFSSFLDRLNPKYLSVAIALAYVRWFLRWGRFLSVLLYF